MISRFKITNLTKISLLIILTAIICTQEACKSDPHKKNAPEAIGLPEVKLDLKFERFEQDLFSNEKIDSTAIKSLRHKYGQFFDLWCIQLAGIVPGYGEHPDYGLIAKNLNDYIHDKYMREIYGESQKQYKDAAFIKTELEEVFKRYSTLFPGKPIPQVVTYLSPFATNVTTTDGVLGVGLHFYLGEKYQYYSTLGLPMYMIKKFRKEYIINDMIKGWLDSEYVNDTVQHSCINQMIYQGKALYALELLTPENDDTIKIGYSANQLDWTYNNEAKIWAFFIEQQLLFSNNGKLYMKFINDGNSTSGFPKEAPAKLGAFIGWQIVRSYMKNNKDVTVSELFKNSNAQGILAKSGYKPAKTS